MSMKSRGLEREELSFEESDAWKALFETIDSKPGSRSNSPSKQVQFDMKGSSKSKVPPLNLDLTNFEVPGAEESRYVLTSPRSLEACARFGVKPIELLHKSYEEFIDEFEALYDTNYSHEAIYEVYQEHERQRKRKLRLCQEERERIINEQERRGRDIIGDFTRRTHLTSAKDLDRQQVVRSTSSPSLHSDTTGKDNRLKSSSKTSPKHSATRNGYEVETSAKQHAPPGKSKIEKSQSFNARDTKTRGETSDSDTSEGVASPHVRRVRSQWSIPKTGSLPSSPRLTRRDSNRSTVSLNSFEPKKQSRTMSTDCILNAVGGKRMSNKDQKIIDLMLTRHEEAQRLRKDKMMLDLAWDGQRQLENDLRHARMKRHQAELYEQYASKDMKQMEARARRERKERRLKQEKEEAIRMKESLWEQERQKQERTLANKIELKRMAEAEKKRQQEEKRRQKEREDEMNRNIAYLTTLEKHERAMRNRNRKTTHEQLKLQIQNESEKIKIEEKREEIARRSKEVERSLKDQITEKHVRAIENYEDQLIRRESEIRNSKRKKKEKVSRQQEKLKQMEEELKDWQKNLKVYQEESLKRAEAVSAMNITKKQLKTRCQLVAKKTEHEENYERVREEEDRRKKELLADIIAKDQRSEMVNTEKEEIRKLSREAAQTSQAVRSIVKEQTFKSSFDAMARRAEIQARVGRGPQKAYKNQSTISLV
ncbi:coiled-coil domain-containing protein 177-like isoform X2 [Actinia tenebrosa]|uniref:Coiled-coil domain-containing protein 177-like isoform X2 n=1 Tax=Actinia tenebrosa TaxID=6105 RepID=A0A6P8IB59_ACTTE|nr:coiled-coil domain-containing protein 177-like isoform X2 [Actinia tenebrosa]